MENAEYVIHLAALHEVVRSVEQPLETHEINVTGILKVLLAARDSKVKRFVFSSSSAVYGNSPELPRSEEMTLIPTSSPYSVSKLAGEYYCRLFSHLYGLETVCLRYFNVYGPRQDAKSDYAGVTPKFISALISDTPPTIYGDGEQTRDFVYVSDCAGATVAACQQPGLSGTVLNIGTGHRTSVNELCSHLQKILGKEIPPQFGPPQPGDIKHDYATIEKAVRLLSYEPAWEIHQGLRETAAWYLRSGI
jgi:nucleoside-diphosphate-sugar epimerase